MINVLFAARSERWPLYQEPLAQALHEAGIDAHLATDIAPEEVDYIVYAPNSDIQDFTAYTRVRAVLNLWAGVEGITGNQTLTVPLCRMVDPGMTQGMAEWVTGHCLRHHLGMDQHITATPGTWTPTAPPLAWDRKVALLGLGELGTACAQMLNKIGFDVHGWSRRPKYVAGITCRAGADGLRATLADAEIVITLLPDTPTTQNILNADTFALLASGAVVINPGRGPLIDDDALLAALDTHLGHATLDVFRTEPLPKDHPFWQHPKVTVTPHIASETRPKYASKTIAANIKRDRQGLPLLHVVDRTAGY